MFITHLRYFCGLAIVLVTLKRSLHNEAVKRLKSPRVGGCYYIGPGPNPIANSPLSLQRSPAKLW